MKDVAANGKAGAGIQRQWGQRDSVQLHSLHPPHLHFRQLVRAEVLAHGRAVLLRSAQSRVRTSRNRAEGQCFTLPRFFLRSTIGARAARSIVDYQKEAEQGTFLDELVAISEQLPGMPSFQSKKARLSAWERRLLRGDRRRVVRYYIDRLYKRLRPRRV